MMYHWEVIFNNEYDRSESFEGDSETWTSAVSELLDLARAVRDGRSDIKLPCRLGIFENGKRAHSGQYYTLTTFADLDKSDDLLGSLIKSSSQAPAISHEGTSVTLDGPLDVHALAVGNAKQEWHRINSWCSAKLSARISMGEANDLPADLENIGRGTDVIEFYSLIGDLNQDIEITPLGQFNSATDALLTRASILEIQTKYPGTTPGRTDETAGSPTHTFSAGFLPIAGTSGDFMIVDLREGELRGSVGWYDAESGYDSGYQWSSISHLLSNLANTLESGGRFRFWQFRVVDGFLEWHIE